MNNIYIFTPYGHPQKPNGVKVSKSKCQSMTFFSPEKGNLPNLLLPILPSRVNSILQRIEKQCIIGVENFYWANWAKANWANSLCGYKNRPKNWRFKHVVQGKSHYVPH